MVSKKPAPTPARKKVLPVMPPRCAPGLLASQLNATPVAPVGAGKLIGACTSNLNVISPLALVVAVICGQVDVVLAVQTGESSVPVVVGSRRPISTPGFAGEFGVMVLMSR